MKPLQIVIFTTTSLSEHLYISLFMTIIIHLVLICVGNVLLYVENVLLSVENNVAGIVF